MGHFLLALSGAAGLALLSDTVVVGHQLDEYLGLTHLNVLPDRVDVLLSLTPGAEIVEPVIRRIDTNGDRQISSDEELGYAEKLRRNLTVALDDVALVTAVSRVAFPPVEQLRSGVGVIHVDVTATFPKAARGRHELFYANDNTDEITVYVVNALKPTLPDVVIGLQDRDWRQRHVTVGFEVRAPADGLAAPWVLVLGIVSVAPLATWAVWWRRRSRPVNGSHQERKHVVS